MKRKNFLVILFMSALLSGIAGLTQLAVNAAESDSIAAISAGRHHTLVLRSDGSLWAWGSNYDGQLGNDKIGWDVISNVPVRVESDTNNWKAVSAGGAPSGDSYTLALKSDGSLWAWGNNSSGQFGNGTTTSSNIPVKAGTDTSWKTISAGGSHALALKTDGSLWAWGGNSSGQLGDGTTTVKNTPFRVLTDTGWKAISAGDHHSLALKTDGSLWAWGG
ncbi:MAG: RCC1 repeat-containing protein, partial [Acidobacteriota bacterium]|nr:RCC1 repeat-containing protein [Acidobacteriota bacterium]